MDCRTARLLLSLARPGTAELEPSEALEFDRHLADCGECRALAQAERQADETLARAMRDVPLPAEGKARLEQRLDAERADLYRRWFFRRARYAAAAAVLLLAAWFAYAHWFGRPRTVNVEEIADQIDEWRGQGPEQVQQWFYERYHIRTVLPRDFNYAYLVARTKQDFEGVAVPCLLFVRGNEFAEVRVLSARQFDLPATPQRAGSGGITIELQPNPTDPHFAYLILYAGPSLDWLIVGNQPPGA